MGKSLVIVESPAKAKTIGKFLGEEFKVMASMGHIRDLPQKKFGVDVENGFVLSYEENKERKKVLDELKKEAKSSETIYLAPDPDREGEAIAWHLKETLEGVSKANFKRVTFHEITKTAIDKAFDNSHDVDQDRVDAQQARRVIDRIVGWQVSDFVRKNVFGAKSAGRVQTVALRLICEREKEIQDFVTREYWSMKVKLAKQATDEKFISTLVRLDGEKVDIPDGDTANSLKAELETAQFTVQSVKSKERRQNPAPPFITSTLQQAASGSLRMSPTQSMRVAQQLYEGVDLGVEGTTGLITYMRTDSVSIAKEAQNAAMDFVSQEYGDTYIPNKPNFYKNKNSAQEAHEAIRPTDVNRTPEFMKNYLDKDQLNLYTLIWKRFVASQMSKAVFMVDTVELDAKGADVTHDYLFRTTASRNIFLGYLKVYNLKEEDSKDEDDDDIDTIPELKVNEDVNKDDFLLKQHFTEPPPRFSEATLVKSLEANGVGRPSTYAAIVRTIQDHEYVNKEKGRLHPSKVGMESCGYLISSIPSLFEIKFTAGMEDLLDEVEHGKIVWTDMLGDFYGDFSKWLLEAKTAGVPPKENVKEVLEVFTEDVVYAEPETRGRRTYSDEKLVTSFRENLDSEKEFTSKQWGSVVRLIAKYKDQLKNVDEVVEKFNFREDYDKELAIIAERKLAAENPDEEALKIIALLDVVNFDEPKKVGKRTYDDSQFRDSLKDQATAGKKLTVNQTKALHKLIQKYQKQIPNYDDIAKELELPTLAENEEMNKEISAILALFDEVTEWNEPTKKGRFTYDDKEFATSLKTQFADKGALSERQIAAAKKTAAKYKDQISDFDTKAKALGLVPEVEKVDANCPECDKPLLKRQSRGRTFFGCSGFPKCKFLTNDLETLAK
ncbi:MAG: type I DNA topoisomerase [Lentisphaeraceae bacterium]|nr:type I DNA topoisomerase [Lentisphaeraceae bacterium]